MNRLIFIILALLLTVSIILLATFMGPKTGRESRFRIRPDENTVLFGVTPWGEPLQMKKAYKPLLEYFSEKTGKKFQLLIMEDYDVAIDNLVEGSIDISVTSPVSYVIAREREPGIQYISTIAREDDGRLSATYKGYLIALKSKYASFALEDFLKNPGKYAIGFVTHASASGWAYPMAMFKKRGFDPEKEFKKVIVFENHPDLTAALASGEIDIGATWEYNLEQAGKRHGDIFSIILTTPDIPGLSWVAAKKANPSFVAKIRDIQAEIDKSPLLKNRLLKDTPDKGWIIVDKEVYDHVLEVVKYVGEFR